MVPATHYAKAPDGSRSRTRSSATGRATSSGCRAGSRISRSPWEEPTLARFFERLASFSRLILFDKRGTGLSDRVPEPSCPTLETRMDECWPCAMRSARSGRPCSGVSEGGPMCVLFAATYPARTTRSSLYRQLRPAAGGARLSVGHHAGDHDGVPEEIARDWGGPVGLDAAAPSRIARPAVPRHWARYLRARARARRRPGPDAR